MYSFQGPFRTMIKPKLCKIHGLYFIASILIEYIHLKLPLFIIFVICFGMINPFTNSTFKFVFVRYWNPVFVSTFKLRDPLYDVTHEIMLAAKK